MVKNKIAAPFKAVMLDILFGTGIDRLGCILDAAMDLDVVERKGSWYAYKGNNLAQGRQRAIEVLKSDSDLAKQLESEVRLALSEIGASLEEGESGSNVEAVVAPMEEEDVSVESENVLE